MKIVYRTHALERMFQRRIQSFEVRTTLENGETIEDYSNDKPYPSRLVLGRSGNRPIHVVVAENTEDDEWIVITVYVPDPALWNSDFRRRLS